MFRARSPLAEHREGVTGAQVAGAGQGVRSGAQGRPGQRGAHQRQGRRRQQHSLPGQPLDAAADQLWHRGAERERADQHPERPTALAGGRPGRHHLQAHRVHAGQRDTGEQAQQHDDREAVARHRHQRRADGGTQGTDGHQPRCLHPVGEVERRRAHRPDHEPGLHGGGEHDRRAEGDTERRLQAGPHSGGGEPRRERKHLHQRPADAGAGHEAPPEVLRVLLPAWGVAPQCSGSATSRK